MVLFRPHVSAGAACGEKSSHRGDAEYQPISSARDPPEQTENPWPSREFAPFDGYGLLPVMSAAEAIVE